MRVVGLIPLFILGFPFLCLFAYVGSKKKIFVMYFLGEFRKYTYQQMVKGRFVSLAVVLSASVFLGSCGIRIKITEKF